MGAPSRSLLLLVAAPLAVYGANGVRAAAGLRRAAQKKTAATGAAKPAGKPAVAAGAAARPAARGAAATLTPM